MKKLSFKKQRNYYLALGLIALFSLLIRIVSIERVPSGVSSDLILYFSNARAIAETGKDIYGNFLPLFFTHKGLLFPPVFTYVLALFYKTFDFSYIVGYLPNIIISTVSIIVCALLATKLTENKIIGIFSAAVLAVSPWHYHLSRTGFEGIFAFCLVLFGIYFSVLALKKPPYYIPSFCFLLISAFTYKAVNIFLVLYPIILFLTIGFNKKKIKSIFLFTISIWFVVFLSWIVLFVFYKDTYSSGYINKNISSAKIDAENERVMSDAPRILRLVLSNTPISVSKIYINNYSNYFSPQYLLMGGDRDLRFSTGKGGQLYLLDLVLIMLGIIYFVKSNKKKELFFLSLIIFVSPLASLISDQEYAIRTFISVFSLAILIGSGGYYLTTVKKTKVLKGLSIIFIIIYLFLVMSYFYRYHFLYIHYARGVWDGVNEEVFKEAYLNRERYERIGFGDSSELDFLAFSYWNKLPIEAIQKTISSYDEKKLQYENIEFIRTCNFDSQKLSLGSIKENDILYTKEPCFKDIEPLKRYHLPKLIIWNWKTYDKNASDNYLENNQNNEEITP